MRVICTGGGFDVEGEVIGGEDFDPIKRALRLKGLGECRGGLSEAHNKVSVPKHSILTKYLISRITLFDAIATHYSVLERLFVRDGVYSSRPDRIAIEPCS